jgi:4-hydroxy-2-oxoheptanedioate aldolase
VVALSFPVVQVETRGAIERISEIASVDGVDGVLFGPADLAADIGHLGKGDHPEVLALMEGAIPRIVAAGKFAGMSSSNPAKTKEWVSQGCSFISIAGDIPILVAQARNASAIARAGI